MKRFALSGILIGILGVGTSTAQAQERITIDACNGVDARAVERILDLEYRNAGHGPLLVGLVCDGDNLTLRVRPANSAERVLVVDLSAVLTVAKPRTVALLIVELSNELVAGLVPEAKPVLSSPPLQPTAAASVPAVRDELAAAPRSTMDESPTADQFVAVEALPNTAAKSTMLPGAPGSEPFVSLLSSQEQDEEARKNTFDMGSPRLSGAIGYAMVSQNFSTPDNCSMCNYSIEIGAPSANLGAKITGRLGPRYLFAADVDYQYAESQLHMVNQYAPFGVDTGVQQHRFRAGARAGYEMDKASAIAAYARAGVQHERFLINNQNLALGAMLPSEVLSGLTLGAMLEFARITSKTSLGLSADFLVVGRLDQTSGLSDGMDYSTRAAYLGARLDYQWTSSVNFTWNYNYGQQSTQWLGVDPTSMREHDGGYASRSDHTHALFAGLSKSI